MKDKKSLIEFLSNHAESNSVSFHMPGHKGGDLFRRFGYGEYIHNLVDVDVTEIYGADNLFAPTGVILDLMERYASAYGAKKSFLSVGGSSNGLMASIMAAVEQTGDRSASVVIARNSHKSIFNGVMLSGAKPIYVYPEIVEDLGVVGEIKSQAVEKVLRENREQNRCIAAVVLASPNYYGICSDIKAVSEICKSYGVPLIVDQAHGAHLKFMNPDLAAENLGADIVVNSIHKTLASFTQTAVVNLMSDAVDESLLAQKLQMIQSSSPSYILMSSLDLNERIMSPELFADWNDNLDWFYDAASGITGLRVYSGTRFDRTKLLLDMSSLGVDGRTLERLLRDKGIYLELSDSIVAMAMTGIGNKREDYERLLGALDEIRGGQEKGAVISGDTSIRSFGHLFSKDRERPLGEFNNPRETEVINLKDAAGRIAAEAIVPYPPGVILVAGGEIIEAEDVDYLLKAVDAEEIILGVDPNGYINVKK